MAVGGNLLVLSQVQAVFQFLMGNAIFLRNLASSRRSVSQGAVQKTAREKIKKARREEARERLWENLTKGHSAHL